MTVKDIAIFSVVFGLCFVLFSGKNSKPSNPPNPANPPKIKEEKIEDLSHVPLPDKWTELIGDHLVCTRLWDVDKYIAFYNEGRKDLMDNMINCFRVYAGADVIPLRNIGYMAHFILLKGHKNQMELYGYPVELKKAGYVTRYRK